MRGKGRYAQSCQSRKHSQIRSCQSSSEDPRRVVSRENTAKFRVISLQLESYENRIFNISPALNSHALSCAFFGCQFHPGRIPLKQILRVLVFGSYQSSDRSEFQGCQSSSEDTQSYQSPKPRQIKSCQLQLECYDNKTFDIRLTLNSCPHILRILRTSIPVGLNTTKINSSCSSI